MGDPAARFSGRTEAPGVDSADAAILDAILPEVSRTFALTIPELPEGLRQTVTIAYLLCRIADTIEDEPALETGAKARFHRDFAEAVAGDGDAQEFAAALSAKLTPATLAAERELVRLSPRIAGLTHGLPETERAAVVRCVRIMCERMSVFQHGRPARGLADLRELDAYCYAVAGVVGEMLTDLFCDYSPAIAARRPGLQRLAVSFGQGLQMTNILKDIWEDLERGFCWLPRDVFQRAGFDLQDLAPGISSPGFRKALEELIGRAIRHLKNGLEYTLLIPPREKGIRHFCLWALGMAVLTLRKIHRHRAFISGQEVKISRRTVRGTILASNLSTSSDHLLRLLFSLCATGLPLAPPAEDATRVEP